MKKNIATNNRKMKTLKQIQSENREAVIMANNPKVKTYEEALEMELGKPLTLNRVLISLKSMEIGYLDGSLFQIDSNIDNRYSDEKKIICDWDLTKETLEEQSEETQREINKLLN